MIAYVNVLALFFFAICNGEVCYWTGNGGSTNNTVTDPANWSGCVPGATSILYINETTCSGCDIVIDMPLKVAELHLGASTGSGPVVRITGGSLTVTTAFTLGSNDNPTTYYSTRIELTQGGMFVIDTGCAATIYYTGGYPISSNDATENWFINKGDITVQGNKGITAGSYGYFYIGSASSDVLNIDNYGSWDVTDGTIQLNFIYVNIFNIYGGSFKGTWAGSTEGIASIYFDTGDVVLQDGAGKDDTGAGGVTFEGAIGFNSDITQGLYGYADPPPKSLTFNTTGVTVSNAVFTGVNIHFLYDGWLMDCNITSSSIVNSTATGVHAYFNGTNNRVTSSTFAGIGTDFIVQVETGTTVTMDSTFSLLGSVTLINNGIWVYVSSDYLYFDADAFWVNLGLMQVIKYSNDFIKGSLFYSSTNTEVGTMVNMGTIEFTNSGGLNFQQGSGTFIQCSNGILKFQYDTGTSPGSVTLPSVTLDGYIGISYENDVTPSVGTSLFTFIPDDNSVITPVFSGDLDILTNGEPLTFLTLVCYDKAGYVRVYDSIDNKGQCPGSSETQFLTPAVGGACSKLDDKIKNLADSASCPAKAGCGIDTGKPTGGGGTPASASSNVASLAFLVGLVCLFLKF